MSIKGINEVQLTEILAAHLSPSKEINDPDRLIGRDKYLTRIRRSLQSPGRHIFIFGERGVGKTSLAYTAGLLATHEKKNFIYIPCGEKSTFFEVVAAIGNSIIDVDKRIGVNGRGLTFSVSAPLIGGFSAGSTAKGATSISLPNSYSEAVDILRFVRSKLTGQIIVAVDELDRVASKGEKTLFAELLKNIGTQVDDMRFILCGIGANVDEVLGEHLSTGRMFDPIEVEKLSHDLLWKIVEDVAGELKVSIDIGYKIRIGLISDGFPHFVHLIGECLFYAMFDDEIDVSKCERHHFDVALTEALQKAEPSLRRIYQMATEKSKNKTDYEEALWALADRTATRRQIKEIYESSYLRISDERKNAKPLSREKLNSRLLTLRTDSHANVLVGHGSGWFSFRENVVRGYVRLKAESEGMELVPDPTR